MEPKTTEMRRRRSFDPDNFIGGNDLRRFQDEVLKTCFRLQEEKELSSQQRLNNNNKPSTIEEPGKHYGSHLPSDACHFRVTSVEQERVLSPPPPSIATLPFDIASPIPPSGRKSLLPGVLRWFLSPQHLALFVRLAGITAAVLSAFFSAVNYAISEFLEEENFSPIEVFAWRQTLLIFYWYSIYYQLKFRFFKFSSSFFLSLPVAAYYEKPMVIPIKEYKIWWFLFIRSVGSSLAILLIYVAIEYIPLSDATVVANSAPIFCSIFARFMLGEQFGWPEILCAFGVICGVTLNARPAWLFDFSLLTSGLEKRLIGLSFALGGALATAFTTVIMRTLKS